MIQKLLQIKYPIVQAPMAGSDNEAFVAAASNAGILGSLGAQYRTPDEITKAIRDIRTLTDKPFALNLFALGDLQAPTAEPVEQSTRALARYYEKYGLSAPSVESVRTLISREEQLEAILQERVAVLSFTLGILPSKWIQAFKNVSTVVIGTATNVTEALALEAAGVDAITAQSTEAGGHRGTFIGPVENSLIGGFALIPQLVSAVKIPIIAAGGIMDGRGIVAARALGAQGVQMGTAFLTAAECPVHKKYKQAIRTHYAEDTVITCAFSGGAARGLENDFIRSNKDLPLLPFPFQNAVTKSIRRAANEKGCIDDTNLWSGQNGCFARELPVAELVERIIEESNAVLNNLTPLFGS